MTRGAVVLHVSRPPSFLDSHEGHTLAAVARSVARLKNFDYAGPHDRVSLYGGSLFFVPDETLLRADADALGVRSVKDLLGGIVPHPFVQTKAISHALVAESAARPDGWSTAFTDRIKDVVLPGYSVFSREEARPTTSARSRRRRRCTTRHSRARTTPCPARPAVARGAPWSWTGR